MERYGVRKTLGNADLPFITLRNSISHLYHIVDQETFNSPQSRPLAHTKTRYWNHAVGQLIKTAR